MKCEQSSIFWLKTKEAAEESVFFLTPSNCIFWIREVELYRADVKMLEELSFLSSGAILTQPD